MPGIKNINLISKNKRKLDFVVVKRKLGDAKSIYFWMKIEEIAKKVLIEILL